MELTGGEAVEWIEREDGPERDQDPRGECEGSEYRAQSPVVVWVRVGLSRPPGY